MVCVLSDCDYQGVTNIKEYQKISEMQDEGWYIIVYRTDGKSYRNSYGQRLYCSTIVLQAQFMEQN